MPNEIDSWMAWAFKDGDAITVTAHPESAGHVRGDLSNSPLEPMLSVENIQVQLGPPTQVPGVRRIFFDVRNVSNFFIPDYTIGISSINK